MAISSRQVQNKRDSNGVLTGKPGTVYDVNIKYNSPEGKKTYSKKGFATKKEAAQHEAEMKVKLSNPVYTPVIASQGKQTVKEYLEEWVENHGKANLRPSTFASYKSHIKNHIVPYVGHVQLNQLTPAMLDNMFQQLFDKGLSNSTVRYAQRILSVSMEHARKYHYIEHNPARDVITKFGKQGKTPDPYTVEQMQQFMSNVIGTEWEMPVVLAGMYGLRMSEIIGLRTFNIDLEKMQFGVVEQMPFKVPPGTKTITEMAPTKSNDRILPITEETLPYFLRQFDLIERQKALIEASGGVYYDNKLFIAKPDGSPQRRIECRQTSVSLFGTSKCRTFVSMIYGTRMSSTRQKKYNSEKQKTQATKIDLIAWVFCFCIISYSKEVMDLVNNLNAVVGKDIHLFNQQIGQLGG